MINIIGAGPAGSYAAMHLAKKHKVSIYEEHKEIGSPIQCTGLLTASIEPLIELRKPVVLNKIWRAIIYAPNGKSLTVNFKKPNIVVDRQAFDQLLAKKAEKAGARIHRGMRFIGYKEGKLALRKAGKRILRPGSNILVGADGPQSQVARTFGLFRKRQFFFAEQFLIKNKDIEDVLYYPYFHKTAWAVPQGDGIVRVGIGKSLDEKIKVEDFAKRFKGKRICKQAGLIPLYRPDVKTQAEIDNLKVFLVGDAACQMKNTTGGAIMPAMSCARILAESINKGLDYEKEWKQKIGKELRFHYKLRNAFSKFSKNDWNKLIEMSNNPKVKAVMESSSRDDAKKMIPKLLIAEPRFLWFARKFI